MRRALLLSLGALALGFLSPAPADEGIAWSRDLKSAQAQAAKDKRPLVLYFTYDT